MPVIFSFDREAFNLRIAVIMLCFHTEAAFGFGLKGYLKADVDAYRGGRFS
jgi:hypothetical protein